jgi:hypothetical protein
MKTKRKRIKVITTTKIKRNEKQRNVQGKRLIK